VETQLPNVAALRELYNQSLVAKAFFNHVAGRERDQSETKVSRTQQLLRREGNDFSRHEVIELFRKLQALNCGQFVEGRHGWPSRFVWSTGMTSVGRAAIGDRQTVVGILKEDDSADQLDQDPDPSEIERPGAAGMSDSTSDAWYEDGTDAEEGEIKEYDITASPNDFNILTLHSFIESGAVKIPGFQRNFVWDLKRASKLIESIVIGLPVPQIFLYEESRNKFLVIDGQQRLMSLFYFIKGRFPRKEKRVQLREIFDEHGRIPDSVFDDDAFFSKFSLQLPASASRTT
jgi:Protein of unknown function DUF262